MVDYLVRVKVKFISRGAQFRFKKNNTKAHKNLSTDVLFIIIYTMALSHLSGEGKTFCEVFNCTGNFGEAHFQGGCE